MELSIAAARQRGHPEDKVLLDWLDGIDIGEHSYLLPSGSREALQAPEAAFDDLVRRLFSIGLRTYAVDLTRPDMGIPAVRLFVPGLCHYKRRLGHPRLAAVPRALGWREQSFSLPDLNNMPLLI
jgi:ribosomal protein S12 methylthiotransferase accessory factor